MMAIFVKEFRSYLHSLVAYIVIGIFLTAMGLLIWVFPDTSVLDYGYADLGTLFSMAPYVFLFLIPAITMRSIADEKRAGTLELLLTKPITVEALLAGKFFASVALVTLALLPTLIYYLSVYQLGRPVGNLDSAGVAGSYIGLFLLSLIFCALGLMASALSPNAVVAFVLAAFFCFLFYAGFDSLAELPRDAGLSLGLKQLGILFHYESMSRGLIDSRDVIYFLSTTVLILFVTRHLMKDRQW